MTTHIIQHLAVGTQESFAIALEPYVHARTSFDKFKLAAILEVLEQLLGPIDPDHVKTVYEFNTILDQQVKPIHGAMMTTKRHARIEPYKKKRVNRRDAYEHDTQPKGEDNDS